MMSQSRSAMTLKKRAKWPMSPSARGMPTRTRLVYSRSNCGSERVGEEEQKHDCLSLPQGEGRGDHCKNDDSADKGQSGDMGK